MKHNVCQLELSHEGELVALQIQLKDTNQWPVGSAFVLYLGKQRWDGDFKKIPKPHTKTTI